MKSFSVYILDSQTNNTINFAMKKYLLKKKLQTQKKKKKKEIEKYQIQTYTNIF